ncbi:MAG: ABC transporter permease [Puniceicoccales bacterium]|jgi:lipopolysaccharide transport system permease protein|nr:ABC transporter permease [Puniceicoccales bacterium]
MFFQTLKRHFDIIFYRTVAGIKSEGRQRYLGYLWFLLEPILSTAVFYLAYSQITGAKGARTILLILIGMILWQWFEGSIMVAAGSIKAKFHVLNQCNLPKYLFPMVSIAVHTWKFLCVSMVIFLLAALLGHPPNAYWLYLPILFILQLALIASIAMPIAIGVTLWTDLQIVVSSIFRMFFFLSGIFFEISSVPESLQRYFFWNPMAALIDSGRAIILRAEAPAWGHLTPAILLTLLMLLLGALLHAHYDKRILKLTNA